MHCYRQIGWMANLLSQFVGLVIPANWKTGMRRSQSNLPSTVPPQLARRHKMPPRTAWLSWPTLWCILCVMQSPAQHKCAHFSLMPRWSFHNFAGPPPSNKHRYPAGVQGVPAKYCGSLTKACWRFRYEKLPQQEFSYSRSETQPGHGIQSSHINLMRTTWTPILQRLTNRIFINMHRTPVQAADHDHPTPLLWDFISKPSRILSVTAESSLWSLTWGQALMWAETLVLCKWPFFPSFFFIVTHQRAAWMKGVRGGKVL